MIELDLHGMTVEEAAYVFFSRLNESRLHKKRIEVNFITGIGKLRNALEELAEHHKLHFYIPMNNAGSIVVEFE